MPTITLERSELPTHPSIEDLLFDFGLEVELQDTTYKIDIPANRYDLLTRNGLIQALNCFINTTIYEEVSISNSNLEIINTSKIRPFICGAIILLNDEINVDELIDYQEKLHLSIGRDRKIVAIGIHDADAINFPLKYEDLPLDQIRFNPLNNSNNNSINEDALIKFNELISTIDKKYIKYTNIQNNYHPSIRDCQDQIISLPPLLNSNFTKLNKNTKSIFVEVTGIDYFKCECVIKLIINNFRGHTTQVLVNNKLMNTEKNVFFLTINEINEFMKLNLSREEIEMHLIKMMHKPLKFKLPKVINCDDVNDSSPNSILVQVPDIRFDVMHKVDIIEDLYISYGYNNIPYSLNLSYSIGKEDCFNKFCDKIRDEMAFMGYFESLNLLLNNIPTPNLILNSIEKLFIRNELISGLMMNIAFNRKRRLPIATFEVGDVVYGFDNKKLLSFLIADMEECLDVIQHTVYTLIKKIDYKFNVEYKVEQFSEFFEKRSVTINVSNKCVGKLGVINSEVNKQFKVDLVCTVAELDLEELFDLFMSHQ